MDEALRPSHFRSYSGACREHQIARGQSGTLQRLPRGRFGLGITGWGRGLCHQGVFPQLHHHRGNLRRSNRGAENSLGSSDPGRAGAGLGLREQQLILVNLVRVSRDGRDVLETLIVVELVIARSLYGGGLLVLHSLGYGGGNLPSWIASIDLAMTVNYTNI